jgi:DNA-binding transcriptional LysR family regulator
MELSDLVTFSTVARTGGVTRAADELNTVQSNITQRVKALEAEIGVALFERHSRGMTLTGAGRRLLPYAQRMVALSREAMLAAREDGEPKGPLAIGSMETTAAVRLPSLLAEFHRRFPAVPFELGTLDGMIGCVAADMGVTLLPRAVVERNEQSGNIRIHALSASQSQVDTLFIHRRSALQYSALQGFASCLEKNSQVIAA